MRSTKSWLRSITCATTRSSSLLVLVDNLVRLVHDPLFQVIQLKKPFLVDGLLKSVFVQVCEQLQVAVFFVSLALLVNHELVVLEVDRFDVLHYHYSNYVRPLLY